MYKFLVFFFFLSLIACDSGPKVIEADNSNGQTQQAQSSAQPIAGAPGGTMPGSTEMHKVVAEESLDTERYTYIRVSENGADFWIAIPKAPVQIGATYYYKGGLIKKDFFSREHNRTFETLYLVSGISTQPAGGGGSGSAVDQALGNLQGQGAVAPPSAIAPAKGAVKISELMKHKAKYAGKTIKVTGKVMKVNQMIMGRNWIHLQDGSGENLDLTVTTQENIPPGHVVTMEGTISLDMDFGAGYRYDIIMENATIAQ